MIPFLGSDEYDQLPFVVEIIITKEFDRSKAFNKFLRGEEGRVLTTTFPRSASWKQDFSTGVAIECSLPSLSGSQP
jgi:hypothetical protein